MLEEQNPEANIQGADLGQLGLHSTKDACSEKPKL